MDDRDNPEPKAGRRAFLKLGVGTAGLAAAGGAGVAVAQNETSHEMDGRIERYSLTPHVERFYFLNRL